MRGSMAVMAGILAFAFVPTATAQKAPAIVFDSLTRDFGKVVEGEDLKHVFTFTNRGQAILVIHEVKPG